MSIIQSFVAATAAQNANLEIARKRREEIEAREGGLGLFRRQVITVPVVTNGEHEKLGQRGKYRQLTIPAIKAKLADFYEVYGKCFPLRDERTGRGAFLDILTKANFDSYLGSKIGRYREFLETICDVAGQQNAGGLNFSVFEHQGTMPTVHSTYAFLRADYRGLGLARNIFDLRDQIALDFLQRTPEGRAALEKHGGFQVFSEQNVPEAMEGISYVKDSAQAIDQVERLQKWRSLAYETLDMKGELKYIQPPIEIGENPCDVLSVNTYVRKVVKNADGSFSLGKLERPMQTPAAVVHAHFRAFFLQSFTGPDADEKDPTTKQVLGALKAAADRGEMISSIPSVKREEYLTEWADRVAMLKAHYGNRHLGEETIQELWDKFDSARPSAQAQAERRATSVTKTVYDKVIVGGGIAGLWTAHEILSTAKAAGLPTPKIVVLAEKINAPTEAGSNIVLGIDGFEEDANHKNAVKVHGLVRNAMDRLNEIVDQNKIQCRRAMGYQLLGDSEDKVKGTADFLLSSFGYETTDFKSIPDADRIKFNGFNQGVMTDAIGQANVPELERGLVDAIRKMGGEVIEGTSYKEHQMGSDGLVRIQTNSREFASKDVPLLATGAAHLQKMGLPVESVYTGALHVHLSAQDARKLSPNGRPIAFCGTNVDGDVFWGSLDEKNVLTIGFGDSKKWQTKPENIVALRKRFAEILPNGLASKYADKVTFSFGPMACTENRFPLVGRMPDFDVNGGWASRGIVPSLAAATAYAKSFVLGDNKDLKLFENFNVTRLRSEWSPARRDPSRDFIREHTAG